MNENLSADLDEHLTAGAHDSDVPVEPGDQLAAVKRLRLLGHLRRRKDEVNAVANQEIARVDQWRSGQLDGLDRDIEQVEAWLTGWHRAHFDERGRGPATIRLPTGELRARRGQRGVAIADDEALVSWAAVRAPQLVRVPEPAPPPAPRPDRAEVRRWANEMDLEGREPGDLVPLRVPTSEGEMVEVPGVMVVVPDRVFRSFPDSDTPADF